MDVTVKKEKTEDSSHFLWTHYEYTYNALQVVPLTLLTIMTMAYSTTAL